MNIKRAAPEQSWSATGLIYALHSMPVLIKKQSEIRFANKRLTKNPLSNYWNTLNIFNLKIDLMKFIYKFLLTYYENYLINN